MIDQHHLKIGFFAVVVLLLGLLGYQGLQQQQQGSQAEGASSSPTSHSPDVRLGKFGESLEDSENQTSDDGHDGSEASGARTEIRLRLGKIGSTPRRSEVTSIPSLPIARNQIRRQYSLAKGRACRMLVPGAAVTPAHSEPPQGRAATLGRVPAITVGLKMNSAGRQKLPTVTRGQVDAYFREHRLSIQPVVYRDASGQHYFGTDCQAAFFELDRPGIAVKSEPMIELAVKRFRTLGIIMPQDSQSTEEEAARTLVMAFTFDRSDLTISNLGGRNRNSTELLLFHLPIAETHDLSSGAMRHQKVPIEVFITSDDRTNLHRLDTVGARVNAPNPTISADIRFDKMVLLGLYPAEPVVTDIHYQSAGSLPMDTLHRLTDGANSQEAVSVSDVLDRFSLLSGAPATSALTGQSRSRASGLPKIDDSDWIREQARRKRKHLNQTLDTSGQRQAEKLLPDVPLMTGAEE